MKFSSKINAFINDYVDALLSNKAAVFAGAGLSMACGYCDWKELLKPVADELGLNTDKEYDLTELAQLYIDDCGVKNHLAQKVVSAFSDKVMISRNHKILASLPIRTYWTTNFDHVLETSLVACGKKVDKKVTNFDFTRSLPQSDVTVYKMNGDKDQVDTIVLTKQDFEEYDKNRSLFNVAFKVDYLSKLFLFIGVSFSDPNLWHLLARIRNITGNHMKRAYYFVKKGSERDDLWVNSLKKYGLTPVFIESYEEIPRILMEIRRRYLRHTVFISGAIEEYDDRWTKASVASFVTLLSQKLSERVNIMTGFGLGVGSHVINGTLTALEKEQVKTIGNRLIMRPFPQYDDSVSKEERQKRWRKYRRHFLSEAGVGIFLFGNKFENDRVVLSDGMRDEYKIAKSKSFILIPVGATGNVAEELWKKEYSECNDPSLKSQLKKLSDRSADNETLINIIVEIVEYVIRKTKKH